MPTPSNNTDFVSSTDRTATGPQPDNTPVGGVGGGGTPGSGTVTSIATGTGLTGGTITTIGTISLAAVADGTMLANTSGGSAAPIPTTLSALLDHVAGSAQGDILYRNASGWVVLAPGTSGYFLKTLGAGANPAWANPSAGGTVTSIATGTGLTGGTITVSGTISLAAISNLTLLANVSGGSAAPTPTTVTALLDAAIASTQGDILYRNASAWVALPPGTAGQILQTAGAGANPAWAAAGAGGTVTSVATGTGLTGGTITTSGTISLAAIADQRILANVSGGSTAPSANTLTAIIDACIGSTQGNLLYRNAATWVVLAPGTAGQLLSTGGAGANPSWSSAAGTGTVTTVSVVTANGVSGSVSNPTTTPAITLTLGDISAATSKPAGTGAVARTFAKRDADVFNVKDFGAVGDGTTNDTAAIQAAVTAALVSTPNVRATIYFPVGRYLSDSITASAFQGRICFCGQSKEGTEFILRTGGAYAISVNLSTSTGGGGTDQQRNAAFCKDMAFSTAAGIVGWGAFYVTYGTTTPVFLDIMNGATGCDNIRIIGDGVGTNGFVDGVAFRHASHVFISNIYAFGSSVNYETVTTYDATTNLPSANVVAGGGAVVRLAGTFDNGTIDNIQWDYWNKGISMVSGAADFAQGMIVSNLSGTVCPYMIYLKGVSNCGAHEFTNMVLDNGNYAAQAVGYMVYCDGHSEVTLSNLYGICNAAGGYAFYFTNCFAPCLADIRISTGNILTAFQLVSCTNGIFHDVLLSGFNTDFYLDVNSNYNRLHNYYRYNSAAVFVTNLGSNNIT